MTISWLNLALTIVLALVSGFLGGCAAAFRTGQWRERVEQRLLTHEKRLEKGNPAEDAVPVLETRLDVLITNVCELRAELREFRRDVSAEIKALVTRAECDRRHGDG